MGQKVNPIGMRVGINRTWDSRWFSDKNYAEKLVQDLKLRAFVKDRLKMAGISKVIIERAAQNTTVTVYTARPGVIIGKKGADIEKLRNQLARRAGNEVSLNIVEVRKPELDALLVAQNVAQQLERRVQFRRAMRRVIQNSMRLGAQGIKVRVAGRLGGAEIARSEVYHEGRVPLHTFRADIDYATWEAKTTYGILGIKVWVFKGEVIGDGEDRQTSAASG